MTTEVKQKLYIDEYAVYGFTIQDEFKILSLVGVLYTAARKKDKDLTVFDLLMKINPLPKESTLYGLYERLQFHLMAHVITGVQSFPSFGLTNAKDVANEIRRLINDVWLPF